MKTEETADAPKTNETEEKELTPVEIAQRTAQAYAEGETPEEIEQRQISADNAKDQRRSHKYQSDKIKSRRDAVHPYAGYEQSVLAGER